MPVDPTTLPALLERNSARHGDRRAIVTDEHAMTHAELDAAGAALAARLVAAGVGRWSRVGLLAPNGIDWAVTATAVMRIGAVLVPLSTLLRPPELRAQLATAAVSHLVTTPAFRGRRYLQDLEAAVPGLLDDLPAGRRHPELPSLEAVWTLDGLPEPAVEPEVVAALGGTVTPADDLVVLFTSGSRGAPKGVIHTHGGALRAIAAGLEARCIGPGEIIYIPMPFFWTGGFSSGLVTALVAGATLITEADPEPTRTLALLERERVTLFRGWPDQAARLAAHPAFATADLSSLQDASLPAVLPPDRRPAPGTRGYVFGMTESFGPYCAERLDRDLPPGRSGSSGRPFAGVEVRVVDPEDGRQVAAGESGEIWLRGPNLLRGICGRERHEVFTAEGFYRTGDLGRVDRDGYLWFSGRLDDMFKVRGATVYPSEVESALRAVEGVRQAHVTDVGGPGGREVAALVIGELPIDRVVAAVRERLSAFKVPTRWLVTGDAGTVPLLATGKPDKAALQRLLEEHGVPTPPG